jgi:hypothetical protein
MGKVIKKPFVIRNVEGEFLWVASEHSWAYFKELRKATVFQNDRNATSRIKRMKNFYEFYEDEEKIKYVDTLEIVEINLSIRRR